MYDLTLNEIKCLLKKNTNSYLYGLLNRFKYSKKMFYCQLFGIVFIRCPLKLLAPAQ